MNKQEKDLLIDRMEQDYNFSEAIKRIACVLKVSEEEIKNVRILKKGMTNCSFCCDCGGRTYIMRIPGKGTENLINRRQEAEVYHVIQDDQISDRVYYINPENGYKLTEFIKGTHVCDPYNEIEVKRCMDFLRTFHKKRLKVEHSFDLWERIEYYESLWNGLPSMYQDYEKTKKKVYGLKDFMEKQKTDWVLTHIDAIPNNFLLREDGKIFLIDWEYAGMQDPHVDIAMFSIYALYDRKHIESLIEAYFPEGVSKEVRLKIYCYISVCGLLWSNWCEYKRLQGIDFGEYSLHQYQYAKDYYRIFQEERYGT